MKTTDGSYLQDISQRMFPHVVRSAWRRRFVQDACDDEHLTGIDEDRVWQGIEDRLVFAEDRRATRRLRQLGPVLAIAAALVLVVWQFPTSAPYQGIKSGPAIEPLAELRSLRFAVVGPAGEMTPGEKDMQVSMGTPIVFSLESIGAADDRPLQVSLDYRRLPFAETHSIAKIEVTEARVMLKGENGYLAFTPHEPGAYVIVARNLSAENEKTNEHSITLRVVAP